jgi:hypothetical protein
MSHPELVLGAVVIVLLGGLAVFRLWLLDPLLSDERPCHRCGAMARFVDDRVEPQGVAGILIVERYQCATCGHEQHRLMHDDGFNDRL